MTTLPTTTASAAPDTDAVAARLNGYVPTSIDTDVWRAVGPWVTMVASKLDFQVPSQVTLAMKGLTHLASWAESVAVPLDTEVLLSPEILERYRLTSMRRLSERSQATEISRLRRIARAVTVAAPWPAPPAQTSRATISRPYSGAEIAALRTDARHQTTPFRRHAMSAVLSLVLGAGLRPAEMFSVDAASLSGKTGILTVTVPGPATRVVPVRAAYADQLRALAKAAAPGPIVLSQRQGRDRANALLGTFEVSAQSPALSMPRLRATWIAEVLTGPIIVADLLAVAGIVSARALSDVLSHQQHPPPSIASLAALAGATS